MGGSAVAGGRGNGWTERHGGVRRSLPSNRGAAAAPAGVIACALSGLALDGCGRPRLASSLVPRRFCGPGRLGNPAAGGQVHSVVASICRRAPPILSAKDEASIRGLEKAPFAGSDSQ